MDIYHKSNLLSDLENQNLFLDNNVLIGCLFIPDLYELIIEIKNTGCELLSINSVFFEFTRGGGSIKGFNSRAEFFDSLVKIWPIERQFENLEEIIVVLHRLAKNMSYTDFLLAAAAYKFKGLLITANHNDFPTSVFDRLHLITIDDGREIHNYGVYKVSERKFNKAAEKILSEV